MAVEFTACPDELCQSPAIVTARHELDSTSGPMHLVTTRCVLRHVYTTEERPDLR